MSKKRATSGNACIGLMDKLYWRRAPDGTRHCYKKVRIEGLNTVGFESLCGKWYRKHSGGQGCARPVLEERCTKCNELEMERRKWDQPGDPS